MALPLQLPDPPFGQPRFCQHCGSGLASRFVEAEGRVRLVCGTCGFIHYLNPKLVANVLPERDGSVLLLRRGIEPSYGRWAFPGGYLEMGESAEEGAEREALEEVGLRVRAGPLLGVYTRVQHGVVVLVFRGLEVTGLPVPGPETLETAWFRPHEIPWQDLAFETTAAALRDWLRAIGHPGPPGTQGP
ncbi:MAG TPA: NUDIX hydrolase [Dehalococcoidia bacterium]|nr:NUDIX hydrolase [Dehalococcoidia bacterium]